MDQNKNRQLAENIRRQYEPKSEQAAKLERLEALDKKVRLPATIFSCIFGCAGALVLGVGMCLAMKIIADLLPLGIVVGIVGIAMVSVNYFIYKAILKARKSKYSAEILNLTDELLNR